MVYYSWGMPLAMQQIGEENFWNVRNNRITEESVVNSILKAAVEIGNKQISLILDQIEDDNYEKYPLKIRKTEINPI